MRRATLSKTKLRVAEIFPRIIFKQKLRAFNLLRTLLLKPFADSAGMNKTNSDSHASSSNNKTGSRSIKMSEAQLARFEVIEQEKEILEDEHQQSLAMAEDLQI